MAYVLMSLQGSSALTSIYSLHGLIDMLQIFALILNTVGRFVCTIFSDSGPEPYHLAPHGNADAKDEWKKLIFGTMYVPDLVLTIGD